MKENSINVRNSLYKVHNFFWSDNFDYPPWASTNPVSPLTVSSQ